MSNGSGASGQDTLSKLRRRSKMMITSPREYLAQTGANISVSPRSNEYHEAPLMLTDLDFFEEETIRCEVLVCESLMTKRSQQDLMKEDPREELAEVYADVQTIEAEFKKTLGISKHLLTHSRDLFKTNREVNEELD
jgi:hypothetical protein